jgi:hypothetical protein
VIGLRSTLAASRHGHLDAYLLGNSFDVPPAEGLPHTASIRER